MDINNLEAYFSGVCKEGFYVPFTYRVEVIDEEDKALNFTVESRDKNEVRTVLLNWVLEIRQSELSGKESILLPKTLECLILFISEFVGVTVKCFGHTVKNGKFV